MKRGVALALAGILLSACHVRAPPRGPGMAQPPVGVDYGHLVYQAAVKTGTHTRSFRLALAFADRGRLRLELLGPMGGPRVIIVSDGAMLQAVFPPQRVFARAEATPENMDVLLGLPLYPEQLLGLLMASPPADTAWRGTPRPGTPVEVRYETGVSGPPTRADLLITDAQGVTSTYTVHYLDPEPGPWGMQAGQIQLLRGDHGLTLRLKDAVRKHPPAAAFELLVPARFEEVPLAALPSLQLFHDESAS